MAHRPVRDLYEEMAQRRGTRRYPFPPIRQVQPRLRAAQRDVRERRARGRRPWVPEAFRVIAADWERLVDRYVAVDDLDDDAVGLSVSPWPMLDYRHRMVFEPAESLDVPRGACHGFLVRHRCEVTDDGEVYMSILAAERELRRREVRVGDVFAMNDAALEAMAALPEEIGDERVRVFDVTRDAREATKIAYYAAAAGTLDPTAGDAERELAGQMWELADDEDRDEPRAGF